MDAEDESTEMLILCSLLSEYQVAYHELAAIFCWMQFWICTPLIADDFDVCERILVVQQQ